MRVLVAAIALFAAIFVGVWQNVIVAEIMISGFIIPASSLQFQSFWVPETGQCRR